jgi:hypothetical protein
VAAASATGVEVLDLSTNIESVNLGLRIPTLNLSLNLESGIRLSHRSMLHTIIVMEYSMALSYHSKA